MAQHIDIQPSEIDALPYYEWQWMLDDMQEILEERKKNQEEQEGNSQGKHKLPGHMQANRLYSDAMKQQRQVMQNMKLPGITPESFKW